MNSISVTNLSKLYQINPQKKPGFSQVSIKSDLVRFLKKPYKIFSTKLIKKTNLMDLKRDTIDYWALKGINFSLAKGQVLGVIGKNGSGKSTLLKVLSGITRPTEGKIVLHGSVASLLAIGLGFHSDLSGRENIFLNGALLGFRKKDIEKELDEIIRFSGIGKFIDTPVKYYSSGMYVRLAFSIATSNCMQPDIFIIDEVLSVGDASFQKKCLARIRKLVKNHKTTVVIVSHNLDIIERLSDRCLLIDQGRIVFEGLPQESISRYKDLLKN